MKILCAEYNETPEVAIVPVGDDVLLRNNGDFYMPDFTEELSCVPQLVVRLCKLGKSVSERFANRYFEEIGVGVRFYADSFEKELEAKNLPGVMASSFDGSAAISGLVGLEECPEAELTMWVNENVVFSANKTKLPFSIESLIAYASEFHTLKIGDFLYCGNTFRYRGLKTGDRIRVSLNGVEKLNFEIK